VRFKRDVVEEIVGVISRQGSVALYWSPTTEINVQVGKRLYLYIDPFQYSALYGSMWG